MVISGCAADGGGDNGDDSGRRRLVHHRRVEPGVLLDERQHVVRQRHSEQQHQLLGARRLQLLQQHARARAEHLVRQLRARQRGPADRDLHGRGGHQLVGRHARRRGRPHALLGAESRALNTPDFDPAEFTDPDTGEFTDDFPTDVVYFDSGATPTSGLGLVSEMPELSDDGRPSRSRTTSRSSTGS